MKKLLQFITLFLATILLTSFFVACGEVKGGEQNLTQQETIQKLSLDKTQVSIVGDQEITLTATSYENEYYSWSSSNYTAVSFKEPPFSSSNSITLVSHGDGDAVIKVKAKDQEATCVVHAKQSQFMRVSYMAARIKTDPDYDENSNFGGLKMTNGAYKVQIQYDSSSLVNGRMWLSADTNSAVKKDQLIYISVDFTFGLNSFPATRSMLEQLLLKSTFEAHFMSEPIVRNGNTLTTFYTVGLTNFQYEVNGNDFVLIDCALKDTSKFYTLTSTHQYALLNEIADVFQNAMSFLMKTMLEKYAISLTAK